MSYDARLSKLESQLHTQRLAPALVLMQDDDADARLAEFRAKHGCDPGLVIRVTSPESPPRDGPVFKSELRNPCVILPHNGREPVPE
jgi:hypothetical protein